MEAREKARLLMERYTVLPLAMKGMESVSMGMPGKVRMKPV